MATNPIDGMKERFTEAGMPADRAAKIEEVMRMPEVQLGITMSAKKFLQAGVKFGFILGVIATAAVVLIAKYAG